MCNYSKKIKKTEKKLKSKTGQMSFKREVRLASLASCVVVIPLGKCQQWVESGR